MIFGIDFDGTITTHEYPEIGKELPYVFDTLRELQSKGHKLILWTMRSDDYLKAAVQFVESNGIKLFGINENPEQKVWTGSPKAYCQLYIDDAALGCPLIYPPNGKRPYVDWKTVREMLVAMGILEQNPGNKQIYIPV